MTPLIAYDPTDPIRLTIVVLGVLSLVALWWVASGKLSDWVIGWLCRPKPVDNAITRNSKRLAALGKRLESDERKILEPQRPTPSEMLSEDVQRDVELVHRLGYGWPQARMRLDTAAERAGLNLRDYDTIAGMAEATRKANARMGK